MRQKLLDYFVLADVPHEEKVVRSCGKKNVLLLANKTLSDEAFMSSNEGSAKLQFLNIKQVYDRVICTCCHPWVPLSEVNIIHREKVVFEYVDDLEDWKLLIVHLYCLMQLDRSNDMSRCN